MTKSWRDAFTDTSVLLGVALVALTEALGAFGLLTRAGVIAGWTILLAPICAWLVWRGRRPAVLALAKRPRLERDDRLYVACFAGIGIVTLYLAIVSAPNAWDAQSYHLPRVLRWIQDGTLAPYPTHVPRQLWIGPGWEYFMLHLQLLAGTDRVANLVQWAAFIGNAVVVSLIARELGAARRGQLFAALFALTLPMAIAQASGSQVDLFSAFWLCCTVAILLRIGRIGLAGTDALNAVELGGAAGLAVTAKATSALFLLPFVVWIAIRAARSDARRFSLVAAVALITAVAINAGPMHRNYRVFGSVLGPPGTAGVTSEVITPSSVASGVIRNLSLHANSYSQLWNGVVYLGIIKAHDLLGIDAGDRRTTFSFRRFAVEMKREDEGVSGNPLHLLLITFVLGLLLIRRERSPAFWYLLCVLVGALLFSAYLKWQPWHSRLHLPLFVLAGAAVAAILERAARPRAIQVIAAILVVTAAPALLRNSLRPIVARHPVFTVPYERRLFTDSRGAFESYRGAADLIASRGCRKVGLIEDAAAWEYPMWKMLERRLGSRPEIRHVEVFNETSPATTARDRAFVPCAVVSVFYLRKPVLPPALPGYRLAWKKGEVTVYLPPSS